MGEFDRLLALTRAAESCNAQAREFISDFGSMPEFSRDSFAADGQVRDHIAYAGKYAEKIKDTVERWDQANEALYWVGLAVGIARPPFSIDGQTYQTAHEAARYLANAVLVRHRRAEGFDDGELVDSLARQLSDLATVPDLYGFIQGETFAAQELCPLEEAGSATEKKLPVTIGEIQFPDEKVKRLHEAIENNSNPQKKNIDFAREIAGNVPDRDRRAKSLLTRRYKAIKAATNGNSQ